MRNPRHAALGVVFLCAWACGGNSSSHGTPSAMAGSGGTSGSGGTGSGDAGMLAAGSSGAAATAVCPASRPPIGALCDVPGTLCELGSDPLPQCRLILKCEMRGADVHYVWNQYTGSMDDHQCGEQPAAGCGTTPPANLSPCADIKVGCFYADTGVLCTCRSCCNQQGCFRCNGTPDNSLQWKCEPPPKPPCPKQRPNLGTTCDLPEGKVCYGDLCDGETSCTGGIWIKGAFVSCD